MAKVCVCYTTDTGYLFPSFVSALQARRNSSPDNADVLLAGFDLAPEAEHLFAEACRQSGILFAAHRQADIGDAPAMLGRLFLADLLPTQYDRLLYIDGDTQITGSLDPLLTTPVPAGKFYAANDPMTFFIDENDELARDLRAHLTSIGLSPADSKRYFNSGVIYAEREAWAKTGHDAWRKFSSQPAGTRFPDQDILNVVGLPNRLPLSLAWNFPIFLRNANVEDIIRPRITHFMSRPKPWEGVFAPWNQTAFTPYREAATRFPGLAPYWHRMNWRKRMRYVAQQRYKQMTETRNWSRGLRHDRILTYEALTGNDSE
ncbi:glycosyltransferase family 8 protein [Acetobacter fallax]|uniref:Glycosyl transferase family 8 n=1 Tax=Acetobacter fallax TaxID=1737473 RepID=A0ABX0K8H9_9PROT|nr:glycosyltransferase [Acetobacter fallax]NHO32695.1 glycosyl transferase family 8 [Acetobacter fallax]NHO36245.1 glycosyl transferase family 8 [Acetobacter fallax]